MGYTTSVALVWKLAEGEAASAGFDRIQPEHLCMGLLKFSELPVEDVGDIGLDAEAARALAAEVAALRKDLGRRSIDSTAARRTLRARLGRGDAPYAGGGLHRSQASRDVFTAAARMAEETESEAVSAIHLHAALLAEPTELMSDALGDAAGPRPPAMSKTPLLSEHGRDLGRLSARGDIGSEPDRHAESKALVHALHGDRRRCVFLVTDSDAAARSVVTAAVAAMAGDGAATGVKAKRVVDITGAGNGHGDSAAAMARLDRLLAESATARDVVLFVPPIVAAADGDGPDA